MDTVDAKRETPNGIEKGKLQKRGTKVQVLERK